MCLGGPGPAAGIVVQQHHAFDPHIDPCCGPAVSVWRHKSKPVNRARLNADTIELIRNMAESDRLWGAERIHGELLKLGIKVSKRTIQKYMRGIRTDHRGQSWGTFLANHADATWACDFIQANDVLFRQVYAFFIVHLGSRKVVCGMLEPDAGVDRAAAAQRNHGRRRTEDLAARPGWQVWGVVRPCGRGRGDAGD